MEEAVRLSKRLTCPASATASRVASRCQNYSLYC